MGNGLNVFAGVFEVALFGNNLLINLAHGDKVVAQNVFIQEFLIGPHVHIRLSAVFAQKRITVLDGVNEPGVDVQIVLAFNRGNGISSFLKKEGNGSSGDAFTQSR